MPHVKLRSLLRVVVIALAILAGYLAVSVLTFQDSPDDPPAITSLFSK